MSLRRMVLALLASASFAAACADGGPIAPVTTAPRLDLQAGNPHPRPLTGSLTGQDRFGGACVVAGGPGIEIWSSATGNLAHLGLVRLESYACMDPWTLALGESWVELRAANGDIVRGSVTGLSMTATGVVLHNRLAGGTGRFASATGSFDQDVSYTDFAAYTWFSPVQGEIAY